MAIQMVLVDYLLGALIVPERQRSTGAVRDDGRAEATENACLVVFSGIEPG